MARRNFRTWVGVFAAAIAALVIAGCGTASKSHGSTRVPAGFVLYRGAGFSFAVPSGFKSQADNISGLPTGSSATILTAAGLSPDKTSAQIIAMTNPHLRFTIDQVATNLRAADASDPSWSHVQTRVGAVTVAGAQEARLVTESYVTPYDASQPTSGMIHRTWLMVMPKPGTLIDVVVAVEPQHGGKLDANKVIDSFRLD